MDDVVGDSTRKPEGKDSVHFVLYSHLNFSCKVEEELRLYWLSWLIEDGRICSVSPPPDNSVLRLELWVLSLNLKIIVFRKLSTCEGCERTLNKKTQHCIFRTSAQWLMLHFIIRAFCFVQITSELPAKIYFRTISQQRLNSQLRCSIKTQVV